MEGFITVQCKVKMEDNKGERPIVAWALFTNPNAPWSKNGYGIVKATPKYPVSFSKLRNVCAEKNMLAALDEREGAIFQRCPANFFKVKNDDGSYTYKVRASFGTKDCPLERTFKVSKIDTVYFESFIDKDKFTLVEYDNEDQDKADAEESEDNE